MRYGRAAPSCPLAGGTPPYDTAVRLVAIGLVAGVFSALFGVGGGIVAVPLLVLVGKLAEEGRVRVRQLRRDANEDLKKRLKNHDIPEDDEKRAEQDIQKLTDRYIGTIDELLHKKTAEILEV